MPMQEEQWWMHHLTYLPRSQAVMLMAQEHTTWPLTGHLIGENVEIAGNVEFFCQIKVVVRTDDRSERPSKA
jgi:hypothetical protein